MEFNGKYLIKDNYIYIKNDSSYFPYVTFFISKIYSLSNFVMVRRPITKYPIVVPSIKQVAKCGVW